VPGPKDVFRREVERELTGEDKEPWEIVYFKLYKSQVPVIDRALETAALMLGSDKSRSYCLEMICADFLAGANLDNGDPSTLLFSMARFFRLLPDPQKQAFVESLAEKSVMKETRPGRRRLRLDPASYEDLRRQVLRRDGWRCQSCGAMSNLEVHHKQLRSHSGVDSEENLISLCDRCHKVVHGN
jgi:HNH endonuclease